MACNNDGGPKRRVDKCDRRRDSYNKFVDDELLTIEQSVLIEGQYHDDLIDLYGLSSILIDE